MAERSDLVDTTKAARLLGVSQNRVRQLINSGQLPAERIGRMFVIRRCDLDVFAALPPGRVELRCGPCNRKKRVRI
jgi:excisionase family DNA binding protein